MAWIKSLVQRTSLVPLPDQQPPPLVDVQRKLLDGDDLGPHDDSANHIKIIELAKAGERECALRTHCAVPPKQD